MATNSALCQACFTPGMAKNIRHGCFTDEHRRKAVPSRNNLLTTIAWRMGGKTEYALEGSVFIGGAAVQWLRDELQLVRTAQELDELAASVPDAGGLFIVPAFAGLGAPHWDPYARGTAVGITRGTNRAHFCRAVIEAIALQSADLISCMEKDSGLRLQELCRWRSVAQPPYVVSADLCAHAGRAPRSVETTARACLPCRPRVGYWGAVTTSPATPSTPPQARAAER